MVVLALAALTTVVAAAFQWRMAGRWARRLPNRIKMQGANEWMSKRWALRIGWIVSAVLGLILVAAVAWTHPEFVRIVVLVVGILTELAVYGGVRSFYASNGRHR